MVPYRRVLLNYKTYNEICVYYYLKNYLKIINFNPTLFCTSFFFFLWFLYSLVLTFTYAQLLAFHFISCFRSKSLVEKDKTFSYKTYCSWPQGELLRRECKNIKSSIAQAFLVIWKFCSFWNPFKSQIVLHNLNKFFFVVNGDFFLQKWKRKRESLPRKSICCSILPHFWLCNSFYTSHYTA